MILSGFTGYYIVYLSLTLLFFLLLFRRLRACHGLIGYAGFGAAVLLGALLPFSLTLLGRLETAVLTVLITLLLAYFIAKGIADREKTRSSDFFFGSRDSDEAANAALSAALPQPPAEEGSVPDGVRVQDRVQDDIQVHVRVQADVQADVQAQAQNSPHPQAILVWEEREQRAALEEVAAAVAQDHTGGEETGAGVQAENDALLPDLEGIALAEWELAKAFAEAAAEGEREDSERLDASFLDEPIEAGCQDTARPEAVDDDLLPWNLSDDPLPAAEEDVPVALPADSALLLSRFEEELDRVDDPSLGEERTYPNMRLSPRA
ncbi:hypothetical protein KDJ56_17745 [Brevibacillus composti]|uniref:Uncharacterized protein n=1 Tax=Brevibacillus composti TaxID=2796470 RepID=A0A7T5EJE9_9BACL|nr:hypothetical protein [Brevibacillus composti]QQE73719.1 hypothetical protein JD108_17805 [Brevibacillus composti]QUO40802.1 hypothetical protein KDJ56_17745 [Brevibacillus composti]